MYCLPAGMPTRLASHASVKLSLPPLSAAQAVRTAYGQQSGDYMASLAAVHCLRRGWQA